MNTPADHVVSIPIAAIVPHPQQPRRDFDPIELERLAESLRRDELMQPIGVRFLGEARYELIWGERRLRAAMLNSWGSIHARILQVDDNQALTMLGSENLFRNAWNPLEMGEYLESLARPTNKGGAGLKTKDIATLFGHSGDWVSCHRQALSLPKPLRDAVRDGELGVATAVRSVRQFQSTPHVVNAIVEDFETNRDAWHSQKACLKRAKFIASRFDALAQAPEISAEETSPESPPAASQDPPAQDPDPPAQDPDPPTQDPPALDRPAGLAAIGSDQNYRPLFEPFRGNVKALTNILALLNALIDEAQDCLSTSPTVS